MPTIFGVDENGTQVQASYTKAAVAAALNYAAIIYNFSGLTVSTELNPTPGAHRTVFIMQESDWAVAAQLRAAGARTYMYQDGLWARQSDPSGITVQSTWANVDPTWKLLNSSGVWIAGKSSGDFMLDVGNTSYQSSALAHTLALYGQHKSSWTGVFLDDQNAHIGWALPNGGPYPPKYPTDAAWQTAQLSYLKSVSEGIRSSGLPVIGNIGGMLYAPSTTTPAALFTSWMSHVDGVLDETFGVGTNGLPTPFNYWQNSLQNQAWCEANGKLFVANVDSIAANWLTYSVASLLLQAAGQSWWNTSTGRYSKYDAWSSVYDRANNLGAPTAAHSIQGVVRVRPFQNGTVLVNPTTSAGSATVKGASVAVPAQSAQFV